MRPPLSPRARDNLTLPCRRGAPRTKTAWAGLAACFVMYALAVAHIALDLARLATDVGRSRELMLVTELCMTAVLDNGYDATCFANTDDYDNVVQPALTPAAQGSEWVPIMFLVLNVRYFFGGCGAPP